MSDEERNLERYIGERIRRRRVELGYTQEQLASDLAVSYQQIQKYERGANRISASRLYSLARRMNVAVSYFYEGFNEELDRLEATGDEPVGHGGRQRSSIEIARHSAEIRDDRTRLALNALARTVVERQR